MRANCENQVAVKIEYQLPCRRTVPRRPLASEPEKEPQGRPPRIARLLALAHRLDALVHSGTVKDYATVARLGHVSAARLSQIMILLHLAPSLQEYVLHLSAGEDGFITEQQLRAIAREPYWDRQAALFRALMQQRS